MPGSLLVAPALVRGQSPPFRSLLMPERLTLLTLERLHLLVLLAHNRPMVRSVGHVRADPVRAERLRRGDVGEKGKDEGDDCDPKNVIARHGENSVAGEDLDSAKLLISPHIRRGP
jgi:hypothetical protein